MATKYSLEGKVCVITGAGSGIGLATAKTLLAAGAAGVTLVDRSSDSLAQLRKSLSAEQAARTLCVAVDVSADDSAAQYVRQTVDTWGRLDVSVQCAGICPEGKPLVETDVSLFDKVMNVNVRGVFLGMQESVKAMLASPSKGKGCSIVLISSQIGLDGYPGLSPYTASKFAVRGLMAAVAQEVGPAGIRVNSICPGPINTPILQAWPKDRLQPHLDVASLKRAGEPEEIADAVLFLASDASSYCTGTTLKVDGGWSKFC
ncbi:hypothetical protein JCM21900_000897 [Sporobolomyces salmonicolor]